MLTKSQLFLLTSHLRHRDDYRSGWFLLCSRFTDNEGTQEAAVVILIQNRCEDNETAQKCVTNKKNVLKNVKKQFNN